MAFVPSISNDEVSQLEAVRFDGRITVVDTEEKLAAACEYLSVQHVIGFDTETRPSFVSGVTYKVSLMQLSTEERCFLVRLNCVPMARPLLDILQNAAITKVGAGLLNDMNSLSALRHFKPRGFVDLQTEVEKYGIADKSLRKISGIVLGKKVSKAQRLSNWEAKSLTPQQQLYAATDAWVCLEILKALRSSEQ